MWGSIWVALTLLGAAAAAESAIPTPDHVVLAVMENRSYRDIIGNPAAPFLGDLAAHGANFTDAHGIAHPSQPNYLALFSGSTHGVGDNYAHHLAAPTLAAELRAAGRSFIGYVERGSPRKHNPWESFADARDAERDFAAFAADFRLLPTVSFVIPNLDHDMHDGSIAAGDAWLRQHLDAYAAWCATTGNLLIVTFDEDDGSAVNRIPTMFYGGPVKPGLYGERVDHYRVLRTIEAMYSLPPLGHSADAPPLSDIWREPAPRPGSG